MKVTNSVGSAPFIATTDVEMFGFHPINRVLPKAESQGAGFVKRQIHRPAGLCVLVDWRVSRDLHTPAIPLFQNLLQPLDLLLNLSVRPPFSSCRPSSNDCEGVRPMSNRPRELKPCAEIILRKRQAHSFLLPASIFHSAVSSSQANCSVSISAWPAAG